MNNKIRFLKASPFYPKYLDNFYDRNSLLKETDYQMQYRTLMDDCFGWADFWKINLEKIGNYEVCEVVTNAEYLQKKWAKEHNVKYSEENWLLEILEAQIAEFKPDVFFAHDFHFIKSDFRRYIKKKYTNIKLIIGWDGVALNNAEYFADYDLIMSCSEDITEYYAKNGFQTYFFAFGFEKSILDRIKIGHSQFPLSFVGSLVVQKEKHNKRLKILSEIQKKIPIDLWLSALPKNLLFSKTLMRMIIEGRIKQIADLFKISLHNHGESFGLIMYQILSDSKISLNIHVDASRDRTGNSRLFEATGVGTCLLTDWKKNISDFFDVDREIVTFKSAEEALEKINYLLSHEEERKKIALAGQKRTLEYYSLEKRLKLFSDYLLNLNALS
jgi:glycosyltransferase involved in cell wall biosynthesis